MTKNVKPLLARALGLRPNEKLELVNALLEDLDRPDPSIEQAWGVESKRRLVAMRSGRIRSYSLAQVFGKYKK